MSECNCPLRTDVERGTVLCSVESESGAICSKPESHDGPHAACSVSEHPVEVWERETA